MKAGTVVDYTLIPAPDSTKNKDEARGAEIYSRRNGEKRYFGMKALVGAGAESGLVKTVRTKWCNVPDAIPGNSLLP